MLPRTELFGIHYPNLLIPVERADEWQASGEHVDDACFQVALASCRFETVRLCISTSNMQADSATPVDCQFTNRALKFQSGLCVVS
jgi:agmatine/peptidylarginine deiminase